MWYGFSDNYNNQVTPQTSKFLRISSWFPAFSFSALFASSLFTTPQPTKRLLNRVRGGGVRSLSMLARQGFSVGLHFRSKKTGTILIVFEDISIPKWSHSFQFFRRLGEYYNFPYKIMLISYPSSPFSYSISESEFRSYLTLFVLFCLWCFFLL